MQFFAYQIGWYRLQCLFDCKNEAGFMWQRKHFRSSTQVLSIAIEAGFVLGVIPSSIHPMLSRGCRVLPYRQHCRCRYLHFLLLMKFHPH